jgi:hypothetical protein
MDWRRELSQLERAYDNLLPNTASGAYNSTGATNNKPFGGASSGKNSSLTAPVIVGESVQFNFKKWSDQGIQQFPPVFELSPLLLTPVAIKYFQEHSHQQQAQQQGNVNLRKSLQPVNVNISENADFNKEFEFMRSYALSIYHRAVENRQRVIEAGNVLMDGPAYLDEEDEGDLDKLTSSVSSYEEDRIQLTGSRSTGNFVTL